MAPKTKQLKLPMLAIPLALTFLIPNAAVAQSAQTTGCVEAQAPSVKAPTDSASGPDSGTKNMGSTGWSGGGLGGSHNDTTAAGPTPGSKTEHPKTAKGLDPMKSNGDARNPC